ncbi:UDP-2,3-diacylglucosamine diphosphatase [Sphingomonas jatrophae]|uniref:UDP-2,3-diacylglucosamine pyrophosphatase LpxH n=1 Tax=Sphingomonas jatrophae TaxID=1166337 RepID=A0A1I6JE75_9SPHN|nr:UDP-2,3-diacylglucosamine diphosphatase [Sphingomonas jatrophae]SFR77333.1 UDP-2,3-diacylglucosamine pyrophosphatase LpxH [Sphingomonas jatrophae]
MASLPNFPIEAREAPGPRSRTAAAQLARRLPAWLADGDDGSSEAPRRTRYRTVWISDIHLGTPGCNADLLYDFLRQTDCETLYLAGDIVDGWQLKKGWYWPARHNDIVRCLLKQAKNGTRVVFVPGNHDEIFRDYAGLEFGGIELLSEDIHVTADGRRLLVIHGDEFDSIMLYARWLAFLGDSAYVFLLKTNSAVNWVRRRFGLPYWSLAAHLKKRVKNAVQFIGRYEEVVAHAARERGVDGVVCGHIHSAEIRQFGDITYYNDGDWVESCTALVEHFDGTMEIIDWAEQVRLEASAARARPKLAVVEA